MHVPRTTTSAGFSQCTHFAIASMSAYSVFLRPHHMFCNAGLAFDSLSVLFFKEQSKARHIEQAKTNCGKCKFHTYMQPKSPINL